MRRLLIVFLTAVARGGVAQNQPWKAPDLRIVDSIRIDSKKEQIWGQPAMALRGDGTVAILVQGSHLVYFDSLGHRRWARELRPDVRFSEAIGWKGDSIAVIDNLADQVLTVGINGGVGEIVDFPDYVRPKWKDRKSMSAYGALDVISVMPDGSLVGTPRRPHSLAVYGSTVKPDPTRVPVVRVDLDGIVQARLATLAVGPAGDVWSVFGDGRLVIIRAAKDSLAFIGISPRGDTTFSRKLPKVRAVFGAVGGPDGTIWVSYTLGGKEFFHSAFDAKGVEIGRIVLPQTLRIGAGDARHLWVAEARGQTKAITRYTLGVTR